MGFLDKNAGGYLGYKDNTDSGISGIYNISGAYDLKNKNSLHGKIVTSNLLLNLDSSKQRSYYNNIKEQSLIPIDWTIGTGGTPYYDINGDGNSRINDTTPFGNTDIVWDISNQDATSDNDGGWNGTYYVPIDNTKMYRFSCWIRKKTIGDGSTYLGLIAHNSSLSNIGVLNRSDGAVNTNAYFEATGWPGSANLWYLFVGHVWPVGSGTGITHSETGVFDINGSKIAGGADYVWQSTNAYAVHRSYMFYSINTATNQQFWQPRIDLCDGSEPTVRELLGMGYWNDISGYKRIAYPMNGAKYTDSGFYFDGSNDYAMLGSLGSFPATGTLSFWMKSTSVTSYKNPFHTHFNTAGSNVGIRFEQVTGGVFGVIFGNDAGTYNGWNFTTGLTANIWYNIAVTWTSTGSNVTGYLNGSQVFSNSNTYWATQIPNAVIGYGFGSDRYFQGYLDNFLYYNTTLNSTQIQQNFNAQRVRYGI